MPCVLETEAALGMGGGSNVEEGEAEEEEEEEVEEESRFFSQPSASVNFSVVGSRWKRGSVFPLCVCVTGIGEVSRRDGV